MMRIGLYGYFPSAACAIGINAAPSANASVRTAVCRSNKFIAFSRRRGTCVAQIIIAQTTL
jgi:hypothetical protein